MIAFAAGLLLGVSGSVHCAAMCGPLVAVADGAATRGERGSSRWRGRAMYHGGRMGVYALLGAAAGASGAAIEGRGFGRGLAIAAGLALVVQACVAAGAARGVAYSGLGTAASSRLAGAVSRAAGWLRRHGLARPPVMGALNGLLPCGLVYAALIAASGTGGVSAAVSLMVGFGLGTLPALLGVGVVSALAAARGGPGVRRVAVAVALGVAGVVADCARPRARDARSRRHGGAGRRSARTAAPRPDTRIADLRLTRRRRRSARCDPPASSVSRRGSAPRATCCRGSSPAPRLINRASTRRRYSSSGTPAADAVSTSSAIAVGVTAGGVTTPTGTSAGLVARAPVATGDGASMEGGNSRLAPRHPRRTWPQTQLSAIRSQVFSSSRTLPGQS